MKTHFFSYTKINIFGSYLKLFESNYVSSSCISLQSDDEELKCVGLLSNSINSSSLSNYCFSLVYFSSCHLSIFYVTLSNYIIHGYSINFIQVFYIYLIQNTSLVNLHFYFIYSLLLLFLSLRQKILLTFSK
jgi:hypothetical protein